MGKLKEVVFTGRDNVIRLALAEDGTPLMAAYPELIPARWLLTIHAATSVDIDSDIDTEAFVWDPDASVIELRLGVVLTNSAPVSAAACTLSLFSTEFPNGVILVHPTCTPDRLMLTICGAG